MLSKIHQIQKDKYCTFSLHTQDQKWCKTDKQKITIREEEKNKEEKKGIYVIKYG